MSRYVFLLICLLLTSTTVLFSQEKRTVVFGKVMDEFANPIPNVHIKVNNKSKGTITNAKGEYIINQLKETDTLILTHISYKKHHIYLNNRNELIEDTLHIVSLLEEDYNLLPNVNISQQKKAIELSSDQIVDYNFYKQQIVFLKADMHGFFLELGNKKQYLPRLKEEGIFVFDVLGNSHILTTDSAFQVDLDYGKILNAISKGEYKKHLQNLKVLTKKHLVLEDLRTNSNFKLHNQMKIFYLIDLESKEEKVLLKVFDAVNYSYSRSYYYSIIKMYNRITPESKNQILNQTWDGNVSSLKTMDPELINEINWYCQIASIPIYAPLVKCRGSFFIFDFSNQKVFHFSNKGVLISSHKLHFPKDLKFNKLLLFDKISEQVYLVSEKQGLVTLCALNKQTGKVEDSILLPHRFPKNIQVNNGFVYYIIDNNKFGEHNKLYKFPF